MPDTHAQMVRIPTVDGLGEITYASTQPDDIAEQVEMALAAQNLLERYLDGDPTISAEVYIEPDD